MPFVRGLTVRILTHERAEVGHRRVVDMLRALVHREALAAMTMSRAVEGYSAHGGLRTTAVVELGDDLPLLIEIQDRADRIERVLPAIEAVMTSGALCVLETQIWVTE